MRLKRRAALYKRTYDLHQINKCLLITNDQCFIVKSVKYNYGNENSFK